MYDYVAKIERERAIATPQPCANCDTGNPAITIVFTRSGDLALCESCYNDQKGRVMTAICENCGGQVATKIEGAKVDYCYRPNCAYGEEE